MNRREAQRTQVLGQLAVFDQAWKAAAELEIDIMPIIKEHINAIDAAQFKVTLEGVLLSTFWRLKERLALRESE